MQRAHKTELASLDKCLHRARAHLKSMLLCTDAPAKERRAEAADNTLANTVVVLVVLVAVAKNWRGCS